MTTFQFILIIYLSGLMFCITEIFTRAYERTPNVGWVLVLLATLFTRSSMKHYLMSWIGLILLMHQK